MSDKTPPRGLKIPASYVPAVDNIPRVVRFEDTGEIAIPLYEAAHDTSDPEEFLEALAKKLSDKGGNSSPKHTKEIKRHNWVSVIMALVLGPGGAVAVIYATSDRSKANSQDIEYIKPQVKENEDSVKAIKVKVGEVKTVVESVQEQQSSIAAGIDELKNENVNRLKAELKEAKTELRRKKTR